MDLWIGAINLGFLYAFMAMGVFITFRIHDFPDITVDGSFVTGAGVTAVLIVAGVNPFLALILSFLAGAMAGVITAFIHTRFSINGLLAGILVMTGLYSVNLHIMGRSNIPLLSRPGVITTLRAFNPGLPQEVWLAIFFFVVALLFWLVVSYFFKTDFGITMRAVGNNPAMAGASGVNVNAMKMTGIALANGFVGISGSLVAQYQGFADIGMGIGSIVFGLAAVIIGESVIRTRSVYGKVLSVIIGSIAFRLMVALALYVGLDPIDLKLITALFVLVILVAPQVLARWDVKKMGRAASAIKIISRRKVLVGFMVILCLAAGSFTAMVVYRGPKAEGKAKRLAIFAFSDNYLLVESTKGIMDELTKSGTLDKYGITVTVKNSHNDYGTAQAIVQDMVRQNFDYIITVSSLALQVTANGNKSIPHVFGTVTDPYRLGVAKSPSDHIPNLTGIATFQPVEATIRTMRAVFPKAKRIGIVWNPSEASSEACTLKAREWAKKHDFELLERTVTSTDEVKDALAALLNKGIDIFLTSGDNSVILASRTIAEILKGRKIPYFTNDPTDVEHDAFLSIGADYHEVGVETARVAERVIRGEATKEIPIKDYVPEKMGVNLKLAALYGVKIPDSLLSKAAIVKR